MEKKLLFNPEGDDSLGARELIQGNSTNIMNLNNVKFKWATKLYRTMMENFWIPEKVDLTTDGNDYKKLTTQEKKAYVGILSFLVFLDSLQTNNVPHISDYITAPEVNLILAIQTYQEAVHSQSYQYIIESVVPSDKRNEVYDYWRKDQTLFKRNEFIAKVYQDFLDKPSEETFFRVVVANYILEGIYFYNGFNFFYNLASRHLMNGTSDVIRYINRDELTHVVLFQQIIPELIRKYNFDSMLEEAYGLMDQAVQEEIRWTNHIIGNGILGINEESTDQYTKWLANQRLKDIGLKKLYTDEKYNTNPYSHLEKISDTGGDGNVKANFFESGVTSYNQSSAVAGWDDF